jgi:hypothetical protein
MRWHAAHLGSVVARVEAPWTFVVLVGIPLAMLAVAEVRGWRRARRREATMAEGTRAAHMSGDQRPRVAATYEGVASVDA